MASEVAGRPVRRVVVSEDAYRSALVGRGVPEAQAQMLVGGETVLGYFVAMKGVDEAHLLNITVAPAHQRQGWAMVLLQALDLWARGQGAGWLWLEVRAGNRRAIEVYEAHGFQHVGLRKAYYPAGRTEREDALVMSLKL